jgi:hypothetical protein
MISDRFSIIPRYLTLIEHTPDQWWINKRKIEGFELNPVIRFQYSVDA